LLWELEERELPIHYLIQTLIRNSSGLEVTQLSEKC
jgi:hypothetical protein